MRLSSLTWLVSNTLCIFHASLFSGGAEVYESSESAQGVISEFSVFFEESHNFGLFLRLLLSQKHCFFNVDARFMMTKKGRPNGWKGDSLSDQSDGLGGAFAFSNLSRRRSHRNRRRPATRSRRLAVQRLSVVCRRLCVASPFGAVHLSKFRLKPVLRTSIRLLNDALLTGPFSSSKTHEKSPDQQLSIRTRSIKSD